ncbi:MAG: TonB-dependent hemoglobin/transferrin/lactoferrin family receptor [Xenophilus sp.]
MRALSCAVRVALLSLTATTALAQSQGDDDGAKPVATLRVITVEGERERPVLGDVTTIDGTELDNANSMADIVRSRPLISAPSAVTGRSNIWNGSGTTGYNIRGLEGNRIGLDVDGIELPYAASMPDASSNYATGIGRDYVDPEIFRQVRIASGTPSAGSGGGSGLGGRVSFMTKTPEDYLGGGRDYYLGLKTGYTSADHAWAEALTGAVRSGNLQALAVYSRRDGHEADNYGDVSNIESTHWHSDALLTRFVWTPNDDNKLGLTLDAYRRTDNRTVGSGVYTSYPEGITQTSTTQRNRISLDHQFRTRGFAPFDRLRTVVYYQDSKKTDDTVASLSSRGYTRYIDTGLYTKTAGLNSEATKQLSPSDTLYYGVNLSWMNEKRPWTEHRYTTSGAASSGYPVTYDRMAPSDTTKLALYARDEHRFALWGHEAILTPALRGEYIRTTYGDLSNYASSSSATRSEIQNGHTSYIAPTLNLTYPLTPTFDAYAQYSRGVRVPTASEKTGIYESSSSYYSYGIIGNPNLKNETSNAFEVGTKGEVARGVTLNASAFYTKYKNFIDWRSVTPENYSLLEYRMENIADATIYGTELSTRFDLGEFIRGARGFSAALAAGITHGESRDSDGSTGGINSVAPAKGSLILAYDDPGQIYGVSFTTTFVKPKTASSDDLSDSSATSGYFRVPGYTKFDLAGYWNVTKHLTVSLALNNLTDKKYWDYSSVRMLTNSTLYSRSSATGRNVSLSASLTF